MASQRTEGEEEALFNSYPCTLYYVQSPSTASQANSNNDCRHHSADSTILSPLPDDVAVHPSSREAASPRFTLSRYSSSRGSNHSFLHDKKIPDDLRGHLKSGGNRLRIIGVNDEGDGDDDSRAEGLGRARRLLSLDPSSSCFCVAFQIAWRLMLSVGIAVLVFFLVTKPPAPKVAFKMVGFRKFSLDEGLDNTGVATKILACNSSMDMEIENNSKVFGLRVHPPTIEMAFGRLKFGRSQGEESYVPSYNSLRVRLHIGEKGMPVYGAGRNMEDMLKSGQGLPLVIRVKSISTYHVVWNLVRMKYHHYGECLLVLNGAYDKQRHMQIYKSSCGTSRTTTYHT